MFLFNCNFVNATSSYSSTNTNLAKKASFFLDEDNLKLPQLNDDNLSTNYKIQPNNKIIIESEISFSYIYVRFKLPPKQWNLQYNDKYLTLGENGFLNEFVTLPSPTTKAELNFPEGTIICEINLYDIESNIPKTVQRWQPPYDDADMLLLPTHADDEHLFFGGIMPYYAGQLNKKVQVAYLVNHYGEWYRPHELLDGLWHVGIKAYPVIPDDFNDYYSESLEHAKKLYDNNKMLEYQVMLLRRFKPEVVIGHDINGEYGHGVHMLNTHLLMQALELSDKESSFSDSAKKYGTFNVPKTYLHLLEDNEIIMDIDFPLSYFDNKTAFEMAVEGYNKHRSQVQNTGFAVRKNGKYDCRKFGLYKSTVGLDIQGKDFFENIKAVDTSSTSSQENVSSNNENSSKIESPSTPSSNSDSASKKPKKNGAIFVIVGIIIVIFTLNLKNRRNR